MEKRNDKSYSRLFHGCKIVRSVWLQVQLDSSTVDGDSLQISTRSRTLKTNHKTQNANSRKAVAAIQYLSPWEELKTVANVNFGTATAVSVIIKPKQGLCEVFGDSGIQQAQRVEQGGV